MVDVRKKLEEVRCRRVDVVKIRDRRKIVFMRVRG